MGDVASITGMVTIGLMLVSKYVFTFLNWRGAALVTPLVMGVAGRAHAWRRLQVHLGRADHTLAGKAEAAAGRTVPTGHTAPCVQPLTPAASCSLSHLPARPIASGVCRHHLLHRQHGGARLRGDRHHSSRTAGPGPCGGHCHAGVGQSYTAGACVRERERHTQGGKAAQMGSRWRSRAGVPRCTHPGSQPLAPHGGGVPGAIAPAALPSMHHTLLTGHADECRSWAVHPSTACSIRPRRWCSLPCPSKRRRRAKPPSTCLATRLERAAAPGSCRRGAMREAAA